MFCGSDEIAWGVLDALRDRSVRVPHDIAVVGFDNWDVIAKGTVPLLTTVDMNLHDLGQEAARRLLAMVAGQPQHGPEKLPCTLVVRDSCGGLA